MNESDNDILLLRLVEMESKMYACALLLASMLIIHAKNCIHSVLIITFIPSNISQIENHVSEIMQL